MPPRVVPDALNWRRAEGFSGSRIAMTCNWWRWLWGVVPLVALAWLAVHQEQGRIETDLKTRTEAALKSNGQSWADVTFEGRDARLSGRAIEDDGPARATGLALGTWGVRVVDNRTDLIEKAEKYVWSAARGASKLRLAGFVPNDTAHKAILSVAKANFPGLEIDDRMALARGAPSPETWLAGVSFALKQLGLLKRGDVRLEGLGLSVSGEALDATSYRNIKSALLNAVPKGLTIAVDNVTAPVATPYVWSATHAGSQLVLAGHVPDEAVRRDLVAAAQASLPNVQVVDRMQPALGAPEGWAGAATLGIRQLAHLADGKAEMRDGVLTVTGSAADNQAGEAARRALKSGMPATITFADHIKVPPPPKPPGPYLTEISVDRMIVVLKGQAPSEAGRDQLGASAIGRFSGRRLDNQLEISPGATPGWLRCLDAGLAALERLASGKLELKDRALVVDGVTDDEQVAAAVPGDLRTATGRDCDATARVAVDAPPEPNLIWSVKFESNEVALIGDVPGEAAKTRLMDTAKRLFKDVTFTDRMRAVDVKSAKWPRVAESGLEMLAKLRRGAARIENQELTIAGEARDDATVQAIKAQLERRLPKGYTGRSTIAVRTDAAIRAEQDARKAATGPKVDIQVPPPPAQTPAAQQALNQPTPPPPPAPAAKPATPPPAAKPSAPAAAAAPQAKDAPKPVRSRACEEALKAAASTGVVRFERARAELDRASLPMLDKVARVGRACPKATIDISGHTDDEGTPERNANLAERRARAVAQYLVRGGFSASRIKAEGYGETRPAVPNDTPQHMAINRRSEFVVRAE